MKRALSVFLVAIASAASFAADSWFGIYIGDSKIGYSMMRSLPPAIPGGPASSQSLTVMKGKLLGSDLDMQINSRTDYNKDSSPLKLTYEMESSGRTQTVVANFEPGKIIAQINNNGQISQKIIEVPAGVKVVDDATNMLVLGGANATKSFKVMVLDPTTVSLIENEVVVKGPAELLVKGQKRSGTLVEVRDPRSLTKIYFDGKGEVIRIDAALGMMMVPESEAEAKRGVGEDRPDIGTTAAIRVEPNLERSLDTILVEYVVSGADLSKIPSDNYQTLGKAGPTWVVSVHPSQEDRSNGDLISVAASKANKRWIQPSLHIPSDQKRFKDLAAKVVGNSKYSLEASRKISKYVMGVMNDNGSIGVLRNANEILDSKEGVCRDYAILAATIMRAAGIPTRVVSGLIYYDGQMLYHAWVEVFSGSKWIIQDPTRANQPTNATRIKLAQGDVEDAFTFPVFEGVEIGLGDVRYR